jgi:hypothetical protein
MKCISFYPNSTFQSKRRRKYKYTAVLALSAVIYAVIYLILMSPYKATGGGLGTAICTCTEFVGHAQIP